MPDPTSPPDSAVTPAAEAVAAPELADGAVAPQPAAAERSPDAEAPLDADGPAPAADDAGPSAAAEAPAPAAGPGAPAQPSMSPAACGDALRRLFPALFDGPVKPLKLRIQADIQARAPGQFSKSVLSAFLRRYTGSTAYLVALTRARQRVDLDGAPAGELADEHRQAAGDELARRRALVADRRAAEDEQRRQRQQLLRDFERTTLTPTNFCALKGLSPDALEQHLAQARAEAAEPRRPEHARRDGPRPGAPGRPGDDRPAGGRPDRRDATGRHEAGARPGPRRPR